RTLWLWLLAPLTAVSAQGSTNEALPAALDTILTPIHSAPDDPLGGAYGLWAGAFDYKVQFATNVVTFHPLRGAEAARPFAWQTESIHIGELELVGAGCSTAYSDYRYEIDYGGIVEAYDVLHEGLEQ